MSKTLILIQLLLVILWLSLACDRKDERVIPSNKTKRTIVENMDSDMNRSLEGFFDIAIGSDCQNIYEILGPPDADRGSGVVLAEYELQPFGFAVIQCVEDVRWILLVWSSDPKSHLPSSWSGGMSESQLEHFVDCKERSSAIEKQPTLLSKIELGSSRIMVRDLLGEHISKHQEEMVRIPLIPRGWSEVYFDSEDKVVKINIVWLNISGSAVP